MNQNIIIKVGEKNFFTTSDTLKSERWLLSEHKDNMFFDADPEIFEWILRRLRTKVELPPPVNIPMECIRQQLHFWELNWFSYPFPSIFSDIELQYINIFVDLLSKGTKITFYKAKISFEDDIIEMRKPINFVNKNIFFNDNMSMYLPFKNVKIEEVRPDVNDSKKVCDYLSEYDNNYLYEIEKICNCTREELLTFVSNFENKQQKIIDKVNAVNNILLRNFSQYESILKKKLAGKGLTLDMKHNHTLDECNNLSIFRVEGLELNYSYSVNALYAASKNIKCYDIGVNYIT